MEWKGMIVLRLAVVLSMIILGNSTINITFGNSECKGKIEYVSDRGVAYDNIYSSCNCTIISNHTGQITFRSEECRSRLFDITGAEISPHCNSAVNVTKNIELLLILKNMQQARNSNHTIVIHTNSRVTGLFNVSCGLAFRSTTSSNSRLESTTSTIKASTRDDLHTISVQKDVSNKDKPNHHIIFSKPDFPYMYVVAAGTIVAFVVLIVFVVVCIRRNRNRIISKEETKGITTQNNSKIGFEHPNIGPREQLPDNPLYISYQENDDVGYSGNENQGSAERLPENPLYHSCQVNKDKEESDDKTDKSEGDMTSNRKTSENVCDINAVYAQSNKIAKVLNANPDECAGGQKEPVYAEVNKMKRK